jgi:hypothetical protein
MITGTTFADTSEITCGQLRILPADGEDLGLCPLRHTDVHSDISGFVSRVTVRQEFYNPSNRKIEAVYVFPLPQDAAVDDMVMTVADRRIVGIIKPREEARRVYEAAKSAGHVASLLDQERPNIFSQSVANIEPGAEVTIEISYVETLKYDDGWYEFVFPMVVGPRFMPGGMTGKSGTGWAPDTTQVPDASKISPPVAKPDNRAGHDISIAVNLNAGMTIHELDSKLHKVDIKRDGDTGAKIELANRAEIPNKDFILRYRLADKDIADALLVHHDERGRFFTLILQPPARVESDAAVPREIVFALDTSGSMRGFPIEKAKEVMSSAVDAMGPRDTFNIITYAGSTRVLWDQPKPNTPQNRNDAQQFLANQSGRGSTEMMKAINTALVQTINNKELDPADLADLPADGRHISVRVTPDEISRHASKPMTINLRVRNGLTITAQPFGMTDQISRHESVVLNGTWETNEGERRLKIDGYTFDDQEPTRPMRVVCFMTDGYVGNDMAIIDAVKKNAGTTRVFGFGIGNSVNRFLLDKMSHAGRGEVEYVNLQSKADDSVKRFHERIRTPVLADVAIDWGRLKVSEVFPALLPDLFDVKPVMIHGRLDNALAGTITLKGRTGEGGFERQIDLANTSKAQNDALPSLWARANVADIMMQDYKGIQDGTFDATLKQKIIDLGVKYRLVTQFTSFVAVEELTVTAGGEPTTVAVPVEMPDGVDHEGVFGSQGPPVGWASLNNVSYGYQVPYGPRSQSPDAKRAIKRHRPISQNGGGISFDLKVAGEHMATRNISVGIGGELTDEIAEEREPGDVDAQSELSEVDKAERAEFLAAKESERKLAVTLAKLATPLQTLAERVENQRSDGTTTIDRIRIIDHKIDVMIYLSNLSEETLDALKKLGFTKTGESKAIRLLFGTIDVRKLIDLAKIEAVTKIEPLIPKDS